MVQGLEKQEMAASASVCAYIHSSRVGHRIEILDTSKASNFLEHRILRARFAFNPLVYIYIPILSILLMLDGNVSTCLP